jgi:hypothetical protein
MKLEILNEIRYRVKVMHQNQLTIPRATFITTIIFRPPIKKLILLKISRVNIKTEELRPNIKNTKGLILVRKGLY